MRSTLQITRVTIFSIVHVPLVDKETIYNLIFDTPQCVNDISIFYVYLLAGTNWICINLMITTSKSKTLIGNIF